MIIKTYLVPKIIGLKSAFLQTKLLIICSTAILGLVFPNHQTLAQIVTVDAETPGLEVFPEGTFIISSSEDYFVTPEGKSVFFGRTPTSGDENVIFTATADTEAVILLNVDEIDGQINDLDGLVFNGIDTIGYINGAENIYATNVNTGVEIKQGINGIEVLGVTEDGRVLYTRDHDDGFDRVMLGETEVYKMGDVFEGWEVRSRLNESDIRLNANGDVFILLEGQTPEGSNINLLFKNDTIIQSGRIDEVWPYMEDGYILLTWDEEILINGTELIYSGLWHGGCFFTTPDGDIFFDGDIGMYHYDADAEGEKTKLLFNRTEANIIFDFAMAITSRGELVIGDNQRGVWLYDLETNEGRNILKEGDEIEGKTITNLRPSYDCNNLLSGTFANDQLIIWGQREGEGRGIFRLDLYGSAGPVYTVSELCPEVPAGFTENRRFEEPGFYPDPFTSSDPIDLREGPCGGNWHTRIWEDFLDEEKKLDWIPGTPDHTDDNVTVEDTDLVISDGPIELKSAHLTGSLVVNSPLTLNNNSSLDSLSLNADLVTNGDLSLTGVNIWNGGDIEGSGSIDILAEGSNSMTLNGGTLNLGLNLSNTGTIIHNSSQLTLTESGGRVTVESGGKYQFTAGTVTGSSEEPNFVNEGTIIKAGSSTTTLDTQFKNNSSGRVQIQEGILSFSKTASLSGVLNTFAAGTAELKSGPFVFGLLGDFLADGFGKLILNDAEVEIAGPSSQFNVSIGQGRRDVLEDFFDSERGVIIKGSTTISGTKPFRNTGLAFMEGGTISAPILNDITPIDSVNILHAGFSVDGGTITGDILNRGVFDFAGDALQSTINNQGDFYLFNGLVQGEINNSGQLHLASAGEGTPLNIEGLAVVNDGVLFKKGSTPLKIKSINNTGEIEVLDGSLTVDAAVELKGGKVSVEEQSELLLTPPTGSPVIVTGAELFGPGSVSITGTGSDELGLQGSGDIQDKLILSQRSSFSVENSLIMDLTIESQKRGDTTTYLDNVSLDNVIFNVKASNKLKLGNVSTINPNLQFSDILLSVNEGAELIQESGKSVLDLGTLLSGGEVLVKSGAELAINLHQEVININAFTPRKPLIPNTIQLVSGDWTVENNATLNLSYDTSIIGITSIQAPVELTIGGGSGEGSPKFNGQPYLGVGIGEKTLENFRASLPPNKNPFLVMGKLIIDGGSTKVLGLDYNSLVDSNEIGPFVTMDATGGTIELKNDANLELRYGTMDDGEFGTLKGGELIGKGFLNGNRIDTEKTKPGKSPGILTVNGFYDLTETGTLEIEVFGTEAGTEYDQLIVNGTATLAGTLRIIPLAEIPEGTTLEPLLADTVIGSFKRIIVENESARSSYNVTSSETDIKISPIVLNVSTFTEYQNALFSETDAADESIGLTTSDPDNDQFSNLLEYAMDLNPWVGNDNPMEVIFEPDAIEGFSRVKVKFPWAKDMTDVDYVLSRSPRT